MADKSFAEHCDYLDQMVRLKLWFVHHWLSSHSEEDLPFVLRRRVDIFRKTIFWRRRGFPTDQDWQIPGWLAIEQRVQAIWQDTGLDADPSTFERKAFEVVWEVVEANAQASYQAGLAGPRLSCGTLSYDPPTAEHPKRVHFHIGNALRPRSILDDYPYLAECFACLMDHAAAECGADSLGTSTWLNSYPRWLAFFPQEYLDHLGPEEQPWLGGSTWGQFVNARGLFNEKHARLFRATGRLPYPSRYSWCSFAALQEHLRKGSPGDEG